METASRFRSVIKVVSGKQTANGKSILSLMLLEATPGAEITFEARGEDGPLTLTAVALSPSGASPGHDLPSDGPIQ